MTRLLAPAILLLTVASVARAQQETPYEFLRIPMSAHVAALGNSGVTLQRDVAGIIGNPAALSTLDRPSASIGFLKYIVGMNAGYAAYGQEIEGIGHVGGSIVYMNFGSMEGMDVNANPTGSFTPGDLAVSAAYAGAYENLRYGAAVKLIYSSIADYSSSALALDAGVQYVLPAQRIVLAAALSNLGAQLSAYGSVRESLPFDMSVGVSTSLEHLPLNLSLDFHKLTESQDNLLQHLSAFCIGGEFLLSTALRARVGYNHEQRRELKVGETSKLAGFSGGIGLVISDYTLDYAVTSLGPAGELHRIGVGAAF
jgi:hypothetical protein